MKIAFIDPGDLIYTPNTPFERPLGGTESAVALLAGALARRGHGVTLFSKHPEIAEYQGVQTRPRTALNEALASTFDVLIELSLPVYLPRLTWSEQERPYQVLWQHAPLQDQRINGLTQAVYPMYDQWVFVSQQQERSYIARQRVAPQRAQVIANGIHPVVQGLFADPTALLLAKAHQPGALRLLYVSSPVKGLDVLAKIYPSFQTAFPGATLEVYSSSLDLYQSPAGDQLMANARAQLAHMPGVKVAGSLPPPAYAERLKQAHILLYPAYAQDDTCGIVVLEAMAAGCVVVTTGNGALSETAAVFGAIAHSASPYKVPESFFQQLAQVAHNIAQQPEDYASFIAAQSDYIRHRHSWEQAALVWERHLLQAVSQRPVRV